MAYTLAHAKAALMRSSRTENPKMKRFFRIHSTFKLIAAVAAVLLCPLLAQAQLKTNPVIDGIIVKLDNQIILKSELEFMYVQAVGSGQPAGDDLKCEILHQLVLSKLLLAKADADSVVVSDDMVKNELDRRMDYFIAQVGSAQRLEEYYNKTIKQLKDELRKQVRDQLVLQKMQDQITGNISVTPKEIRRYFERIPTDSLPYFSTEVEVGQIVKYAQLSKKQKQEARAKLENIRQRILNGEDFQALAKQYSEDPASAKDGGELGFFKRRELVPEYEAAALRLEPGQLSSVIESQFGFHLIQMIEKRGEQYNTRHILIKPASGENDLAATAELLDSVRTRVLQDSITFAKAAREFSDDKFTQNSGGLLSSQNGNTYIPLDKLDPAIFFTIDTMQVGEITPPLPYRTEDGKQAMRILYLKSRTPPHQANLKDDYQKIAAAALNDKKATALEEWFEKNKDSVFIDIDPEYVKCNVLDVVN